MYFGRKADFTVWRWLFPRDRTTAFPLPKLASSEGLEASPARPPRIPRCVGRADRHPISSLGGQTGMRLSQSAAYAIHAAAVLARQAPGSTTPCGKIAAQGRLPERFLLQILRALVKSGILESTRGGGGGFVLRRPPEQISLLEIIEAIDGPIRPLLPPLGAEEEGMSVAREVVERALAEVACRARQHLATVSLADLAFSTPATPAPTMPPTAWVGPSVVGGTPLTPLPSGL